MDNPQETKKIFFLPFVEGISFYRILRDYTLCSFIEDEDIVQIYPNGYNKLNFLLPLLVGGPDMANKKAGPS